MVGLTSWRAIALATGLILTVTGASAQTPLDVQAATQDGYARLSLKGAAALIEETRMADGKLYLQFEEPVVLDTETAFSGVADYVGGATLSPGGTILTLDLKKAVTLRTSNLGDAAMVDLVDAALPEALVRPVRVRVGEHAEFDRVVFDWPRRVAYQLSIDGETATVTFEESAIPDLSRFRSDTPASLSDAQVDMGGTGLAVTFRLAGPARVENFRDGPRIVLDFYPQAADSQVADQPPVLAPVQVEGPARRPMIPVVAAEESGVATTTLEVSELPSGLRLRLPLKAEMPAAIFGRAGTLWLVLAGEVDIDPAALESADPSLVQAGNVRMENGMTVLTARMDPALQVIARRLNRSWEVDLTLYPAAPTRPLDVSRRKDAELGPMAFVAAEEAPAVLSITDPDVGDRLAIVPLAGNGLGMLDARRFAEFTLLQTAQGLAVQMVGDNTEITALEDGLAIHGGRGLGPGGAEAGEAAFTAAPKRPRPVIDFETWRRGADTEYQAVKTQLMQRLAEADDTDRNKRRFDLATFLLAHGMAQEALGYLTLMREDDADLEREPRFLAVRGIARFEAGRYAGAEADLSHRDLAEDPKVNLWLARVAVEREDWAAAHDYYRRGLEVLTSYPEVERAWFQLAGFKAARALGDMEAARRELLVLSQYDLPPALASEVSLFLGEVYAAADESGDALAAYDDAIAQDYRPTRVRAEFDRVQELLEEDAISHEEAIAELERLRFVWRGDDLELKVLRRLGELYIENGEYRAGLARMRSAVTHFNGTPEAREITRRMSEIFRDLFLDGGTQDMSPVRALALYYDFRELTPIGYEGDQMIRRLADRLVRIDLLGKAAELLEHQVNFRLEGAAQAQVAENLAAVYLLDRQPEKALETIRETTQPQLPEDITRRRRHLEARALVDIKRFDEAAALLEDDNTPEAVALKADLYWKAEDWPKAAASSWRLLEQRAMMMGETPAADYDLILRCAVATSLADDGAALARVAGRYGDAMEEGPYARTFDLITSDAATTGSELREIVDSIADVSAYETYLASYKGELMPVSAAN